MGRHVATFWYLSTDAPSALFTSGVKSDPGFARRLLSRLYPKVTLASLGTFPLNRSATAGPGEIYIGSFPGLTVVQAPLDGPVQPSATAPVWLRLVDSPVVLKFSYDKDTGVYGFARWESGKLVRSFAAADDRIVEDEGMPLPFERPYWAGEFPLEGANDNPLALPFSSSSLLHAAHRAWLDFDLEPGGLDVPVDGFATDGRREVRPHTPAPGAAFHLANGASRAEMHAAAQRDAGAVDATAAAGAAGGRSPYDDDDYERISHSPRSGAGPLSGVSGLAGRLGSVVRKGADRIRDGRGTRPGASHDPARRPGSRGVLDSSNSAGSGSASRSDSGTGTGTGDVTTAAGAGTGTGGDGTGADIDLDASDLSDFVPNSTQDSACDSEQN